jgi:hypothetical protein
MADIRKIVLDRLANGEKEKYSEDERVVLQRIAASRAAQAAFNTIAKTEDDIKKLIQRCIHAKTIQRKFPAWLKEERDMAERLRQHRRSVEDLRQFINRAAHPPKNPFMHWLALPETDQENAVKRLTAFRAEGQPLPATYDKSAAYYREALDRITLLLDERQHIVEDTERNLAVTYKYKAKTAAENSAMGWLADQVFNLTGKPFAPQVAILAQVVLGIDGATDDRVREALKMRRRKSVD